MKPRPCSLCANVNWCPRPDHAQYCHLSREEQAQIIATATGGRGANRDYLWSTAAHLAGLGIADPDLEWLAARVRVLT